MNEWTALTIGITVEEMLRTIDDGLCFGFEFKVESHTLYYRECK